MISKHLQWNELSRLSLIGSVALEQLKSVPELSTLPEPKVHIWNMMSLLAMVESGNGVTILATLTIPRLTPAGSLSYPLQGRSCRVKSEFCA